MRDRSPLIGFVSKPKNGRAQLPSRRLSMLCIFPACNRNVVLVFHSFGLEMLESLVSRHSDLREKYFSKARSNYLPHRVADLMRSAFPMGQIFCGSLWQSKVRGTNGENDILVIVDAIALVIECKSG